MQASFQECLRSSNCTTLTLKDYNNREKHDDDNMRMVNDHFKTSEIYGDKVAIVKTSSVRNTFINFSFTYLAI